jgi:hypothetical protein
MWGREGEVRDFFRSRMGPHTYVGKDLPGH